MDLEDESGPVSRGQEGRFRSLGLLHRNRVLPGPSPRRIERGDHFLLISFIKIAPPFPCPTSGAHVRLNTHVFTKLSHRALSESALLLDNNQSVLLICCGGDSDFFPNPWNLPDEAITLPYEILSPFVMLQEEFKIIPANNLVITNRFLDDLLMQGRNISLGVHPRKNDHQLSVGMLENDVIRLSPGFVTELLEGRLEFFECFCGLDARLLRHRPPVIAPSSSSQRLTLL